MYDATHPDKGSVVAVLHRDPLPSKRRLAARRHAYDAARRLAAADVVVPHLDLVPSTHDLALILERTVGYTSLADLRSAAPTVPQVCRAGAAVARALGRLHSAGFVHGNLYPEGVLVDDATSKALFTDLSGATAVETTQGRSTRYDHFDAQLTYMSPEQTGRVSRPVDARSDIYNLGVMLFELVTGEPPFTGDTARALVHAHIARLAPRVETGRPGTPVLLGDLIERLLAKDPEARYATAAAVAYDLESIAADLEKGKTPSFSLAATDSESRLRLSDGLLGRDAELQVLRAAYGKAATGGRSLVFVSGYSGVGKSRLVSELHRPVARSDGWFATGKFDLYRRDLPYGAWIEAASELIQQVLTLPGDELATLTDELRTAVGASSRALAEMLPDLHLLLGPQASPADLTPGEARARLESGIRNMTKALSTEAHPLLLFIDDLQWSDLASLRLLDLLIEDSELAHVMVVAAWRDNEVGPGHHAWSFVERHRHRASILELDSLTVDHVTELIAATLDEKPSRVETLAKLAYDKTVGNPFFVRRFIHDIHEQGLLCFDAASAQWTWDDAAIERHTVSENVGDLVSRQLGRLDQPTKAVLQIASCIGPTFDLFSVAAIAIGDLADTIHELHQGVLAGLLVPMDSGYIYADAESGLNPGYSFLHDRVQESVHESMTPERRAAVHLEVARQKISAGGDDDDAVDIASHLSAGMDALTDGAERIAVAEHFVRGAERAKAVMATDVAHGFLDHADNLLPSARWSTNEGWARRLHTLAADLAYIDGRFDDVDRHADAVLAHSVEPLDRMPIHNIRIGIGIAQNRWSDATEYALDVLKNEYDIELPMRPTLATVGVELARLRWELRGKPPESLLELPSMDDPMAEAAMTLLMKTATNAYWASPNLVPLIGFTMVRESLRKGNTGLSAYGYVLYGLVLSAALFEAREGYRWGTVAMEVLDRTGSTHLEGRTGLVFHALIRHGVDPLADCGAELLETFHAAESAGDIENAAYCSMAALYSAVVAGESLSHVAQRLAPFVEFVATSGHAQTIYGTNVWLQAIANLRADRVQPELTGEHIDFEPVLAELMERREANAIPQGVCAAGFLAFMLDDTERAERHLGTLFSTLRDSPGQAYLMPCLGLYGVLLARKSADGVLTRSDRAKLTAVLALLKRRARTNEHDHIPFILFIQAERAAAGGRPGAETAFIDAAEAAAASGITYVEGLALERAAELHADEGHEDLARHLLGRAVAVWRRYGAHARLRLLGYEDVSAEDAALVEDESIDVSTLLDTAAAVSSELEVSQVVARVLELALQSAGASRALLALREGGELRVEAVAELDEEASLRFNQVDRANEPAWARAVGDYVVRTDQDLVIGDTAGHHLCLRDPYFVDHRAPSLLCAPLRRGGEVTGLLYLENHLGPDVFNERHLAVARTIVGQAVISIENAGLYEQQSRQARAFSRFVPRQFLGQLGQDSIVDVQLGDAAATDVAVLSSDLRDFTTLSEQMTPREAFEFLNAYLARMEPPVDENAGFVDQFVGDAVTALFPNGADAAISAALGMVRGLAEFNLEFPDVRLRMGIGIHAGPAVLGTIGTEARMQTTVIGDVANTASRIEGMTKVYFTPVLVSSEVLDRLRDPGRFSVREVGRVRAKGKTIPTTVHEILDARDDELSELHDALVAFGMGLRSWYAGNFDDARAAFAEASALAPCDELAAEYVLRCDARRGQAAPDDWDGIDVMTDK